METLRHSPFVNKLSQSLLHDANLVYTRKEDKNATLLGENQTFTFVGSATETRTNKCSMIVRKKERIRTVFHCYLGFSPGFCSLHFIKTLDQTNGNIVQLRWNVRVIAITQYFL